MNYSSVSSLAWADESRSRLDAVVTFEGLGELPFTASATDIEEHSREIFAKAIAGNFGPIAEYIAPPPLVPRGVSPAQAKIALHEAGLLDQVEALVTDYPYRPVSIWWVSALAFERGHPYLNALGLELGLSDEQIDALFIAASKR